MKYYVLNRSQAEMISKLALEENTIIVSITDLNSPKPNFADNPKIIGVLTVQFDDVAGWERGHMTNADARNIVSFVDQHLPQTKCIVVHCEYGISRSAGVCGALMSILNEKDNFVFKKSAYMPNAHCYHLVSNTYFNRETIPTTFENITNYRLSKQGNC